MSSKQRSSRKRGYSSTRQPFDSPALTTVRPVKAVSAERLPLWQRLLPHKLEDDMARMRLIVIVVVMLLVIEFIVFAFAFSASPQVVLNKNGGQEVIINTNGTSSGNACSPGTGGSAIKPLNPQSPSQGTGSSLQNSPAPQVSGGNNLQASPQVQCL